MLATNQPDSDFGIEIVGQKNTFFEKRTGEVIENTGKGYMDSQKQTGKQSGEVIENTSLWKKQTGTNRKTNRAHVIGNIDAAKIRPQRRNSLQRCRLGP